MTTTTKKKLTQEEARAQAFSLIWHSCRSAREELLKEKEFEPIFEAVEKLSRHLERRTQGWLTVYKGIDKLAALGGLSVEGTIQVEANQAVLDAIAHNGALRATRRPTT